MNDGFKLSRISIILRNLSIILRDKERKTIARIAYEFVRLSIAQRSIATHYFSTLLHKKAIRNYRDYLSSKEMHRIQEKLCDPCSVEIVDNKLLFQEFFSRRSLPLPRLIAYNFGKNFFLYEAEEWRQHDVTCSGDFRQILEGLLAKSPNKTIFIKLINGSLGVGAHKITSAGPAWTEAALGDLYHSISRGNYLVQDEVVQHEELRRLNPTSVNTLRIDTFKQAGGRPEVISALLRMGLAGSPVDNIAAGGLYVGVVMEKGTLKEFAFNKLAHGGHIYRIHPTSGTEFLDYRIPLFEEAKGLALKAAAHLPAGLIGWDIAIGSSGPVLMEGNAVYYSMELSDLAYGGYRLNPVYLKARALFRKDNRNL